MQEIHRFNRHNRCFPHGSHLYILRKRCFCYRLSAFFFIFFFFNLFIFYLFISAIFVLFLLAGAERLLPSQRLFSNYLAFSAESAACWHQYEVSVPEWILRGFQWFQCFQCFQWYRFSHSVNSALILIKLIALLSIIFFFDFFCFSISMLVLYVFLFVWRRSYLQGVKYYLERPDTVTIRHSYLWPLE